MRGQGLVQKIGVKVPISLFFERVGEAESFVELSLQDGIRPEAGLDHEETRSGRRVPIEERHDIFLFILLLLLRGVRETVHENAN